MEAEVLVAGVQQEGNGWTWDSWGGGFNMPPFQDDSGLEVQMDS